MERIGNVQATDLGSIEAVAASIIDAPVEEETVAEELTEEVEAVEADADDVDDVSEADDADDAEEYDESEAEEVQEEPVHGELYTVKVDGKTKQVTLDELTRGYSGQAYIQQNLEQVAEAKKAMQQQYQEMQNERQFLAELRQKAEQGQSLIPPKPPSKDLFEKDPIGYMEAKINYDEDVAEYQKQQQVLQQMDQREATEKSQRHMQYLQQQMQTLQERIPEFADPQKAPAYRDKMIQAGTNFYGFSSEELSAEADARRIAVLNDAMKYREMQEAQGVARQKADGARPVVKPGTKRTERTSQVKKAQQAASRMKKTGTVDDVAKFLLS
jgi:hypothetical protein